MFLYSLYHWVFKRLPRRFSIIMILVMISYFALTFHLMLMYIGRWIYQLNFTTKQAILHSSLAPPIPDLFGWIVDTPFALLSALITIALAISGVVFSYWLAGLLYGILPVHPMKNIELHGPALPRISLEPSGDIENPLARFHSIGIILSGGGAKGAYQAGAMKAIYEFLEKHDAHHKVRMIAGSSIGAWNALFWLSNLIKNPEPREKGLLEKWWSKVGVQSVIRPSFYLPFRRNFFLSNQPWQQAFDMIFGDNSEAGKRLLHHIRHPDCADSIHFYFTRANVGKARLEFATNRNDLETLRENLSSPKRPRPVVKRGLYNITKSVRDIRRAVFSSMDLPPLFEYARIEGDDSYFEDGGVIDNLPIRFGTEIEKCDLLFVLPLNAHFGEEVNLRSIIWRLLRVMNVRQGVLERNSFKMIYLYNELAALREHARLQRLSVADSLSTLKSIRAEIDDLSGRLDPDVESRLKSVQAAARTLEQKEADLTHREESAMGLAASQRASQRRHQPVQVFAICPAERLVINTAEFWKTKEAGRAFRLMYRATTEELDRFDFQGDPSWIEIAQVGSTGLVSYLVDF